MIDEIADLKTQFRQAETENRREAAQILEKATRMPLSIEDRDFLRDLLGIKDEQPTQDPTVERQPMPPVDQITQDVTAFMANLKGWGEDVVYSSDDPNHPGFVDMIKGTITPDQLVVIESDTGPEISFSVRGLPITIKGDSARRLVGAKTAVAA